MIRYFICLSLFVSGCGHLSTADTFRQGCAAADITLIQTTQTATAIYTAAQQDIAKNVTKANASAMQTKHDAYDHLFDQFLATMKAAQSTTDGVCALADTLDANGNAASMIAQVAKVVADVSQAITDFQSAIEAIKNKTAMILKQYPLVRL